MKEELARHARERCEAKMYHNVEDLEDEPREILILGRGLVIKETVDDPLLGSLFSKLQGDEVGQLVQEDDMGRSQKNF